MFPTLDQQRAANRRRELGSAIMQLRLSRKMTQSRAAELLDWSRTTLIAIEQGKQAVTADQLFALADLLHVDVTAFFPLNLNAWLSNAKPLDLSSGIRGKGAARRAAR